jgi:hypothetical protein
VPAGLEAFYVGIAGSGRETGSSREIGYCHGSGG